jgi:hypothetical protein
MKEPEQVDVGRTGHSDHYMTDSKQQSSSRAKAGHKESVHANKIGEDEQGNWTGVNAIFNSRFSAIFWRKTAFF